MFKRWSDYLFLLAGIGIAVGIGIYFYVPLPVRVKRLSRTYRAGDERAERAGKILKSMGAKALPALTKQLSDKHREIRLDALEALKLLASDQYAAISAVQKLLRDPHWQVRKLSAIRLGEPAWFHPTSLDHLAQAFEVEKEWTVRQAIIESIGKLGLLGQEKLSKEVLLKGLEDPDWSVRTEALRALSRLVKFEEGGERFVIQMLRDPEPNVRKAALKIIAQQKGFTPEIITPLFELYRKEKDKKNKELIVSIFREFPAPPLKEALDFGGGKTALAVAKIALFSRKINGEGLEELLFQQLRFHPPKLQKEILATLAQLYPKGVLLFISALNSPEHSVKIAAAQNLARLSKYSVLALPELKKLLQSSDFHERFAAAQAWEKLPPPLPKLREISLESAPELQKKALQVAIFLGPKAILLIVEALSSNRPQLRLMAVKALGAHPKHQKIFLLPLVKKIADPDPNVRQQTFQTLLKLGPKARSLLNKELFSLPLPRRASVISSLSKEIVEKLDRKNLEEFYQKVLIKIYEYPIDKKLTLIESIKYIPRYFSQLDSFFKAALNAPEEKIKNTAFAALMVLKPTIRQKLLPQIESELRYNIEKFHAERTPKALRLFIELLEKKPENIEFIRSLLLKPGNIETKKALLRLLQRERELAQKLAPTLIKFIEKKKLWGPLFHLLSQINPPPFRELKPLFDHPDPAVRWGVIELLSRLKYSSPQLLPYLKKWKKAPELTVRTAAARLEALLSNATETSKQPTTRPTSLRNDEW